MTKLHIDTDLGGDVDDLCAVALGWSGVKKALVPLTFEVRDGWLYERVDASGRPTTVVVEVDGLAFNTFWLETVTA